MSSKNTASTRDSRTSAARLLRLTSRPRWRKPTKARAMAIDLTTRYLGLTLRNPIVAGAGPLTGTVDNIRRLEDFGAGAVVLPSIFEEQIEQEQELIDRLATTGAESYAESLTYFPAPSSYGMGPARYLETLHQASQAVDIPV